VGDDQNSADDRVTHRDLANLRYRVVGIVVGSSERIEKNGRCFFERDAVLVEVACGFPAIPFVAHNWALASISSV